MKDIQNKEDIVVIVEAFYDKVMNDPIIAYIFTDVMQINLESHLPIINNFWHDLLFGTKTYNGNALAKHMEINAKLPLKAGHFTRWLYLFKKSIDENNAGQVADLMKFKADTIADSINAAIQKQKRGETQLVLPSE